MAIKQMFVEEDAHKQLQAEIYQLKFQINELEGTLARELDEAKLREQYPMVRDAYEKYQFQVTLMQESSTPASKVKPKKRYDI